MVFVSDTMKNELRAGEWAVTKLKENGVAKREVKVATATSLRAACAYPPQRSQRPKLVTKRRAAKAEASINRV